MPLDQPVAVAEQLGPDPDEENPYLLGVFAPVDTEITADELEVVGEIPHDLSGVHLRNGPNRRVLFDGLLRYDRQTGERTRYDFGPGRFGSEAPFAPRAGSGGDRDDADGYLVSFVTDARDGRSEVEILDASDIAAGPVARVRLPQRVPVGFHATRVRSDQLRSDHAWASTP